LSAYSHVRFVSLSARAALKKAFVVAGVGFLLLYLFVSRSLWFPDLERQIKVGNDRLSKEVDLTHAQTITWKISGDDWKYTGECRVALILDRVSDIPPEAYRKESMALKLKMDAYAVTYEPTTKGTRIEGFRVPRLIRNWYFRTDSPLSPDARIWESWGKAVELGLCGVQRYPWEDTYITLEVIQPDPVLAKANPKLEIVGDYDYAVFEHITPIRIFRDFVLLLLGLCVLGLAYVAIKQI
jgi:hypothetical protein